MQQQQQQLQLQLLQLQQLQAAAAAAAATSTPVSSASTASALTTGGSSQVHSNNVGANSLNNSNNNNHSSSSKFSPNATASSSAADQHAAQHQFASSMLMLNQLSAGQQQQQQPPSTMANPSSSASAAEHLAAAAEFAQRVQHLQQQQQQQSSSPLSRTGTSAWQDHPTPQPSHQQLSPSPSINPAPNVGRWSSPQAFNPTTITQTHAPFPSTATPAASAVTAPPAAAHLPSIAHNNSSSSSSSASPHTSASAPNVNSRLLAQMSPITQSSTSAASLLPSASTAATATPTTGNNSTNMIAQPSRDFGDNHLTNQSAAALLRLSSGIGTSSNVNNTNNKLTTGKQNNTTTTSFNDKQYLSSSTSYDVGSNSGAGGSYRPISTSSTTNNINSTVQPQHTQQQLNPAHMNNSTSNNNSNNNRQNLQWIENLKAAQQLQIETAAKLQLQHHHQQQQQQQSEPIGFSASDIDNSNKLAFFPYTLMSPFLPGTKKPKKLLPLDNVDGLKQSIYSGEFYTKFEDLAIGILSNQIIVPEFSIIDYIRRDKFNPIEIERIESVHKRLGLTNILYLLELTQPHQFNNLSKLPPATTNAKMSSSIPPASATVASSSSPQTTTTLGSFLSDHQNHQHQQQFHLNNNTGHNLNQQSHSNNNNNRCGTIDNTDSSTNALLQSQYMPIMTTSSSSSSSLLQCKPDHFHSPNSGTTTPKQSSQSPSDNNPNNRSHQSIGSTSNNFPRSGGSRLAANAHSSSTSPAFSNISHQNPHPFIPGSPSSFSPMITGSSQPLSLSLSSGTLTTTTSAPFQQANRSNQHITQQNYHQAINKSPYARFSPQPPPLQMLPPHQPPPLHTPSSLSSLPPLLTSGNMSSVTSQLPPHLQHLNPILNQQQLPPATSSYGAISSSQIQYNLPRPPRSHSTIGGPGLINDTGLPGLNGLSSATSLNQFRQPPAAHQSSMIKSTPPTSRLGGPSCSTEAPPAHALSSTISCGPPVTAHQSSRLVNTPARLQASLPPKSIPPPPPPMNKFTAPNIPGPPRPPFGFDDRSPNKNNYANIANQNINNNRYSPLNRHELGIDPSTGLSIQALLSLKQSASPTHHYGLQPNQGPPTSSPSMVGSGGGYYLHGSGLPISPRNHYQSTNQQSVNAAPSLLSLSDGIVMKVPMSGASNMPSSLHIIGANRASPNMNASQAALLAQDSDNKSANFGLYGQRSHSSLVAAHQKLPGLDTAFTPSNSSPLAQLGLTPSHSESALNSLHTSTSQSFYNDLQQKQQPFSISTSIPAGKVPPQQVSPKRSIITGSGSSASRKSTKKSKPSPTGSGPNPADPKKLSLSPNESNPYTTKPDKVTLTPRSSIQFSDIDNPNASSNSTIGEARDKAATCGLNTDPTRPLVALTNDKLQDSNNNNSSSMSAQQMVGESLAAGQSSSSLYHSKLNLSAEFLNPLASQAPQQDQLLHGSSVVGGNAASTAMGAGVASPGSIGREEHVLPVTNNNSESGFGCIKIERDCDQISANNDAANPATKSLLIEKNDTTDCSASSSQQNRMPVNDINAQKATVQNDFPKVENASTTSKYQKLYTKKAWLKNYDLEDQNRIISDNKQETVVVRNNSSPAITVKTAEETLDSSNPNDENKQTSSSTEQDELKATRPNSTKSSAESKGPSRGAMARLEAKKKSRDNSSSSNIKRATNNSYKANSRNGASTHLNYENDSEETNASTSGLEDSDGPSSLKSTSDSLKKLRRMPKRKVKVRSDKDGQNFCGTKSNTTSPKNAAARKRAKIEKGNTESNLKRKCNSDDDMSRKKQKKVKQEKSSTDDVNIDKKDSEDTRIELKEPFLQVVSCYDIVAKSIRCLECRRVRLSKSDIRLASRSSKANWDDFCRFYEFRKLRYNQHGHVVVAGFSSAKDATKEDKRLWVPDKNRTPENFTFAGAKYILANVGKDFNALYQKELSMIDQHSKKGKKVTWKRAVNGLRELCDVCSTTLFNCHFVCERCGFVVCIDCYAERSEKKVSPPEESSSGDTSNDATENGESQSNNASKKNKKDSFGWIYCPKNEEHSIDRLILTQIIPRDCFRDVYERLQAFNSINGVIEDCVSLISEEKPASDVEKSWLCDGNLLVLNHEDHQKSIELFRQQWRQSKPVLVRGVDKAMKIDMWLPQYFGNKFGEYRSDLVDCRNGDIHRQSMKKYWEDFEPSAVPSSKKRTKDENSLSIPHPSTHNDGCTIGPSYYSGSALWRLKDWPPGQDFGEILPEHYEDFMSNLPLKQYTTRGGKLNLANRLPKEMLMPDLGPKMYSAYGAAKFPERGTTNLHLDICDAINVMIYVNGATAFKSGSEEFKESYERTIEECVVDDLMKKEIREQKLIPGAMWHIFDPQDADKIRHFLDKVCREQKIKRVKGSDHIHDQTWYLSQNLLDRLHDEYDVKSHAILQCMGDAILIPAGAPHQVKNVQNCIKVANDFVSPENVRYCIQLTGEFRNLPDTHINQEDKLQIRNIIYHSVKESLQYMEMFESKQIDLKSELDEDERL